MVVEFGQTNARHLVSTSILFLRSGHYVNQYRNDHIQHRYPSDKNEGEEVDPGKWENALNR